MSDADEQRAGAAIPTALDSLVVQASGVLAAPGDGELLLVREETDECYALRGSGVDIWTAAREPTSVGGICDRLVARYAIDRGACERAVLGTVEELVRNRLFVAP
jgi:hypothetical protein